MKYYYKLALVFAAYYASAYFGLKLEPVSGFASLVWIPTGISLAAFMAWGLKMWPAVAAAAFLVNFQTGAPPLAALGIMTGNTLEGAAAGWIMRRYFDGPRYFERINQALGFILFAALIAPVISATFGVTSLLLSGTIGGAAYTGTWFAWWLGDVWGALFVTPFILTIVKSEAQVKAARLLEACLLGLVLALLGYLFFLSPYSIQLGPLPTIILIPTIWAALRFSVQGAAMSSLITSAIAIYGTFYGLGPFAGETSAERLMTLQPFLAVLSVGSMILAVIIHEKSHLEDTLKSRIVALDKARAKYARERALDRAIIQSVGDGMVVTDEAGRIVMVNKAFEKMLGFRRGEAYGKVFVDLVKARYDDGRAIPKTRRASEVALRERKTVVLANYNFITKSGKVLPALVTANPMLLEDKSIGVVVDFTDITVERELDKAKTEFVSIASHQLRTPLSTVAWYNEMLLAGDAGKLTNTQKDYLGEIYSANNRMINLVNALLNVSRIELGTFAIEPVPTDILTVARRIVDELKPEVKRKKIKVTENYANIPKIAVDPKLLEIIFDNLLSNAVHYSREAGRINIDIGPAGDGKPDKIFIKIEDNGYGIPEYQKGKIFTKLFRADNVRLKQVSGSGLGLYVVKSILDAAGGNIWFESRENEGTTFYVTIPMTGMKSRRGTKKISREQ